MTPAKVRAADAHGHRLGAVTAGRRYWIRCTGFWWDFYIPCTADGYPAPLFYMLGRPPTHEDGIRYMRLWGCVTDGERPGPEDPGWRRIGSAFEFVAKTDGVLWVAANDRPGWFFNNWGAIKVYLFDHPAPALSTDWIWTRFTNFLLKINGIPLIAGLLALLWVLLDVTPQGRDLMVTTAPHRLTPDQSWPFLIFTAMSMWLSLQCWFWPRSIIVKNFGSDPDTWTTPAAGEWRPGWFLIWAPRALGLAPFVIGLIGLLRAHADATMDWIFAAIGLAQFVVYIFRRELVGWRMHKSARRSTSTSSTAPADRERNKRRARFTAYFGVVLALVSVTASGGAMVLFCLAPVAPAQALGSAAVVYLAVSLMIPVLAGLSSIFSLTRFPLVIALVVLAVFLSPLNDDHQVGRRVLGEMSPSPGGPPPKRPSLEQALAAWKLRQPPGEERIVLVAAAGGASRAGYWTALALNELDALGAGDPRRPFSDHVFAISSVSGGSVGAAGYVAEIATRNPQPGKDLSAVQDRLPVRFSDGDFLSPALAGLLFPDLIHRFLPLPILPDRADAFERGLEARWRDRAGGSTVMSQPFLDLWKGRLVPGSSGGRWTPLLLINGTREEDGRRVITAPIAIDPNVFLDAVDFYQANGSEVRLSTAIHNGARFPVVSPAGLMTRGGRPFGHIIDGGYFDNAGTETLRDLIQGLLKIDPNLRPIIVEINNEDGPWNPSYKRDQPYDCADVSTLAQARTSRWANDVLAPLIGIFSVRDSHGTIASVHLARFGPQIHTQKGPQRTAPPASQCPLPDPPPQAQASPDAPNSGYAFIHLYPYMGERMPMNWVLSRTATARARRIAGLDGDDPCGVNRSLRSVIDALQADRPPQPAAVADPPALCNVDRP